MELKISIAYEQVLDIIKQLPVEQLARLLAEANNILEKEKSKTNRVSLPVLLLSAPTMSDEQHIVFLENRKMFNQWRTL